MNDMKVDYTFRQSKDDRNLFLCSLLEQDILSFDSQRLNYLETAGICLGGFSVKPTIYFVRVELITSDV